jgi:hypothetical protein
MIGCLKVISTLWTPGQWFRRLVLGSLLQRYWLESTVQPSALVGCTRRVAVVGIGHFQKIPHLEFVALEMGLESRHSMSISSHVR